MSEATTVRRAHRALRFMASAGAVTIVVGLVYGLTRPAPPRDVAFVGGPGSDRPRCHGSVLWTGEVAYAVCDWAYRERAVVAFDPAAARATVLHLWSNDDGNVPVLEIVRPCEGGQLFVVRETRQTTLLRRRGEEVRVSRFASQWSAVLGAECRGDAVELFTAAPDHSAIYRVAGERPEPREVIGRDDMPGAIVGAWFAGDAWHVVVQDREAKLLLAGELGSALARIDDRSWARPACVVGEPGGWLGTSDMLSCSGGVVAWWAGGGFRVTQLERTPRELVVHAGATPGFGFSIDDPGVVRFGGPGAPELDLYERDGVFQARRGDGAVVTIAGASHSTLNLVPRALPLSGDRVAIWGGIGDRVVILGPDLRRVDAPGPLARVLRPWSHFRASAMSTFDVLCFYALLLAAPAWLLARVTRGRRAPGGLIRAAGLFVALCLVGGWGFLRVVAWL